MLTRGDDYVIHQTPEPIAFAGTDRNFYDRYFFNGYRAVGSDFFAVAFGVYPHLNVADAHFSCIRGGTQHCLHASRLLGMERMDLSVGPIRIEILQPLKALRVIVERRDGIAADLTFTGRAFPLEEPRFTRRIGPRTFVDHTRLTQNGHWAGWIEIDGERRDIDGAVGTRDRSWGIRPVGASDPQPFLPEMPPQFYWLAPRGIRRADCATARRPRVGSPVRAGHSFPDARHWLWPSRLDTRSLEGPARGHREIALSF